MCRGGLNTLKRGSRECVGGHYFKVLRVDNRDPSHRSNSPTPHMKYPLIGVVPCRSPPSLLFVHSLRSLWPAASIVGGLAHT